jgi:hypothetical protein
MSIVATFSSLSYLSFLFIFHHVMCSVSFQYNLASAALLHACTALHMEILEPQVTGTTPSL